MLKSIWDFFQNEVLGMKWLADSLAVVSPQPDWTQVAG